MQNDFELPLNAASLTAQSVPSYFRLQTIASNLSHSMHLTLQTPGLTHSSLACRLRSHKQQPDNGM